MARLACRSGTLTPAARPMKWQERRGKPMTKASEQRRFDRQFESMKALIPQLAGTLQMMRHKSWRLLRVPISLVLILGGVFSFLPVLGIWMLPLGLMLLALDVPILRAPVSVAIIRVRRRLSLFVRKWRRKN